MTQWRWAVWFSLVLALASACGDAPVPFAGGDHRILIPSLVSAPANLDLERLATTEDCVNCHSDVGSHWAHSTHAYASFDNPWYRASVDEFREQRGARASRFCAGCHDPLLLVSGEIDAPVDATNPRAFAGITCTVCHSIEATEPDGNGSFTLTDRPILIPDPAVPHEIEAHRQRLTMKPLRTGEMCGACHRSFSGTAIGNDHHLPGIDDLGDWRESAYGDAVPDHLVDPRTATCQGCHMQMETAHLGDFAATNGEIHSHRWASSHTAIAAQLDATQRAYTEESLKTAARIAIGAVVVGDTRYLLPEEAQLQGGRRVTFDVLLENVGVGHRFPGGTRDMHDVWVEIDVRDGAGEILGTSQPNGSERDDVFLLRATMLDARGTPEILHDVHRFASPAFDRTLAAHGAQIVRYDLSLPSRVALPIRVTARLIHRKHSLAFQEFACAQSRTERGQAFARQAPSLGKIAIDPCLTQPITILAESVVDVGDPRSRNPRAEASERTARRLLAQGHALLGETQERVALARPSLDRARTIGEAIDDSMIVAQAEILLARLAAVQGRPDDAVPATKRAEAILGPVPVLDRIRGDAFANVWRWREAADAYERVVRQAPSSSGAWRALAHAYGSLARDEEALEAADAGLRWAPRDEGLLRTRALALRGLGRAEAEIAEETWLRYRSPDSGPQRLAACERAHVRCRTDRQPIPRYQLRKGPRKAIPADAKSR
ncbi:MAG: multiheme c-type cytochrome [Polyangiales bacterium]